MMKPQSMVGDAHPTKCRLIIDPPASGAWNMAVDEALLIDAAESGITTLRLYEWNEPTLSLGYFQHYEERHQHAASRECACVRRQTGGGAILHDQEITYSIVLPPGHPCARPSNELYAKVHDAFIKMLIGTTQDRRVLISLRRLGEVSNAESAQQPFLCFQRRAMGDVVAASVSLPHTDNGRAEPVDTDCKILGSAQRRSRGALLQHGSLLLRGSAAAPELAGYHDVAGLDVSAANRASLIHRLEEALSMPFSPGHLPKNVESNARQLANNKYGAAAWTKRR